MFTANLTALRHLSCTCHVNIPCHPYDNFFLIGLTWGSMLVHDHVLLGYTVLYVPLLY